MDGVVDVLCMKPKEKKVLGNAELNCFELKEKQCSLDEYGNKFKAEIVSEDA